jgi:hypothetical protein
MWRRRRMNEKERMAFGAVDLTMGCGVSDGNDNERWAYIHAVRGL